MADEHAAPPPPAPARPRLGEGRNTQAKNPMLFILLVVALCIVGWFLVSWMSDSSKIQDCVMSGRKNCGQMDPALGR